MGPCGGTTAAVARVTMPSMRPGALLAIVTATVVGAGCVSTRHVTRPSTPDGIQMAIDTSSGPVTLLCQPAEHPPGRAPITYDALPVAIGPEGIWVAPREYPPHLLQVRDLQGFTIRRHGLGWWEGLGIGTLVGVAGGALIGYAKGDDPACDRPFPDCVLEPSLTAGDKAILGGVLGAVLGGITGGLVGLIVGHTDRYVFTPPP